MYYSLSSLLAKIMSRGVHVGSGRWMSGGRHVLFFS